MKSANENNTALLVNTELPNEHHMYLHANFCCSFLIQIMDQLEGSHYYRGTLKNRAKMLIPVLTGILDPEMTKLARRLDDATGLNELMKEHEDFIKEACRNYAHSFAPLTQIMKLYREDPESVLTKLDFQVLIKDK